MCWSAEVSLQSFLIGLTATLIATQKGLSLPITIFCLTIVFMQLIEYGVWTWYENKTVNFSASLAAAFLLFLQPIASLLTLPSKDILLALQAYLGLSFLTLFLKRGPLTERYQMVQGSNGHLVWMWLQKDWQTGVSLAIYFLFLLGPLVLRAQWELLALALGTLGFSLYSFYKDNTWGSMWCWLVNYLVVGVSLKQILISKP